ncbi:MAG: hypothetical protein ACOVQ3_13070 [Dolichospermum sp.]|jgi:hypothetical protein
MKYKLVAILIKAIQEQQFQINELQSVINYAVTGVKDGKDMQGVYYSKIVTVLIKSIQELKAELDTLKNK